MSAKRREMSRKARRAAWLYMLEQRNYVPGALRNWIGSALHRLGYICTLEPDTQEVRMTALGRPPVTFGVPLRAILAAHRDHGDEGVARVVKVSETIARADARGAT